MDAKKCLVPCLVALALLFCKIPAYAAGPIDGLWTIESGSDFFMAGVGGSSLLGGTDGGLLTGQYQPDLLPTTPVGDATQGTAIVDTAIFNFFGFTVGVSTNEVDPVDGVTVYPVPSIVDNGDGTITGDIKAWDALWNGTHFNQGAPKDNSVIQMPDNAAPSGTLDAGNRAYTLSWESLIVGGPFNGFLGAWTLVGTAPEVTVEDQDGDGIIDALDNCPTVSNPDQADLDGDALGDACDDDDDGDGVSDAEDCEPLNPAVFPGAPENCTNGIDDNCNGLVDTDPECEVGPCAGIGDDDGDQVCNDADNCINDANPAQADLDGDGIGDACDCDADGDAFDIDTPVCAGMDCDDLNAEINPGMADICNNGIDENCDGADFIACTEIVGTLRIEQGSSFFLPGAGGVVLASGTDGGLKAGQYQSDPEPTTPVDDATGSTAIVDPSSFVLMGFPVFVSTNAIDPVDGVTTYPPPTILDNGDGTIQGNLQAWDVLWGGMHFNQGSPRDLPGTLADAPVPFGTFDPGSSAYTLTWNSIFVGGPFDGAVAEWSLGGTVAPEACPDGDQDGDQVCDSADNCPAVSNPAQEDLDADGLGDACDDDQDGDGAADTEDCEPRNPAVFPGAPENCTNGIDDNCNGMVDTDPECQVDPCAGIGDDDGDQVCNDLDNCPAVSNPVQEDLDADGLGDACDDDQDGDGAADSVDCEPRNPAVFPGASENCTNGIDDNCNGMVDTDPECQIDLCTGIGDNDGDQVCNNVDNCLDVSNPDQADRDGDGIGDACDCDNDNDGFESAQCGGNDCDDLDASINPEAAELCGNAVDENCDGVIAGACDGAFGDVQVKLHAPNKVEICGRKSERPKKVKYQIHNKDGDGRHATPQTVSYLLKLNGQVVDSGAVALDRNEKAHVTYVWDPSKLPAARNNIWEVTAEGEGADPILGNNLETDRTRIKVQKIKKCRCE